MVTAIHDISTALQAIRRGAYDYILKPFEKEQLFHAVGRAWQHRQLVTENKNYQINLPQEVERKTAEPTNALDLLTQSYDDTIAALGSALDLKDMETAGHSQRVAAYTNSIAKQERVRLSERTKAGLAIARSNGRQIGRPRLKVHSSEIARLRAEGRSLRAIGRELGISEGSVRRFVAAWVRKKGLF
jgi:response regulator RpfG family c-di-GMP phosphodiesterase